MRRLLSVVLLLAVPALLVAKASVGGNVAPDGTQIQNDLPGSEHLKNTGGSDGAGLCVFTSLDHSARWQFVEALIGFRDWMKKHPGGGYPAKVDRMIDMICKERNLPKPEYIQVEGSDLSVLKEACKSGRFVAITYERSPTGRYGGGRIAHMVSMPHIDDKNLAILDNNFPGPENYEWMTPDDFMRVCNPRGYWAVILLANGPPPVPRN